MTVTELHRTFAPELEIRSAAQGGDGRTVVGIAVPYNRSQRIDATLVESFARGAFDHQLRAANRIPFAREHMSLGGTLIGKAIELRDDAAGLWGAFRVSKTAIGEETLELIRDGALDQLSIGFREVPGQNRRLNDGTIERVKAHLREVSVVMNGAYGEGAVIEAVRAQQELVETATAIGCSCRNAAPLANLDRARQVLSSLPLLPPVA